MFISRIEKQTIGDNKAHILVEVVDSTVVPTRLLGLHVAQCHLLLDYPGIARCDFIGHLYAGRVVEEACRDIGN